MSQRMRANYFLIEISATILFLLQHRGWVQGCLCSAQHIIPSCAEGKGAICSPCPRAVPELPWSLSATTALGQVPTCAFLGLCPLRPSQIPPKLVLTARGLCNSSCETAV